MKNIITLTVNPAVDKSASVAGIKPDSKLRCSTPIFEAGGGGINVSKVLGELGGKSLCIYLAGGPTGRHLKDILVDLGILQQIIPVAGWVRENLAVTDTTNNQQYRFGMPGPSISEDEWKNVLDRLDTILSDGDLLVASGSLCPGMPIDFYARVSAITMKKNVKLILDTSGEALLHGAQAGAYLLKPNLGELASLCNLKTISFSELESISKNFLENNPCEIMVVSIGAQGAILVTKDTLEYIAAPVVYKRSAIGAGDSMVAGMAFALAQGRSDSEMAKYGVACGTAATMTEGTQLCRKEDVDELYNWIVTNSTSLDRMRIDG
ncbi:6-phosphofructokinase II [Croceitalea sp. MTPC9]|uniref:1-phosphofructokinase family hexose kinase n=1 Tax=unclassified Croceitalea TaxID=2632280 RepID=UPI002B371202|nr:6-phosphofructokinase II [Croceitalea sp. MTPC6]GMN17981.1 6-phosphofructokinase II [Croceitalea sp. MTPC9]